MLGPASSTQVDRFNLTLSSRGLRWVHHLRQSIFLAAVSSPVNNLLPVYITSRILSLLAPTGPKRHYHRGWPLSKHHSPDKHQLGTSRRPTANGLRHRCPRVGHLPAHRQRMSPHETVEMAVTLSRRTHTPHKRCDSAYNLLIGLWWKLVYMASFFAVRSRIPSFALLLFPLLKSVLDIAPSFNLLTTDEYLQYFRYPHSQPLGR